MKRLILFLLTAALQSHALFAQQTSSEDSSHKSKRDSMMAAFLSRMSYPLIKGSDWSGVIPVDTITEKPDAKLQYKLVLEDVFPIQDSASAAAVSGGINEVARLLNLHIASGIPEKNLNIVVVVHGSALFALVNNEIYHKKYGIDNPNLPIIEQLLQHKVRIIACGQSLKLQGISSESLVPNIGIALTAQTILTNYRTKGYVWIPITDE